MSKLHIFSFFLFSFLFHTYIRTHFQVAETAFEEWNYAKALSTQQYIMVEEKHPMRMLPAPLNIITTLLIPWHNVTLSNAEAINQEIYRKGHSGKRNTVISVSGSAADVVLGVLASFVLPFIEIFNAITQVDWIFIDASVNSVCPRYHLFSTRLLAFATRNFVLDHLRPDDSPGNSQSNNSDFGVSFRVHPLRGRAAVSCSSVQNSDRSNR